MELKAEDTRPDAAFWSEFDKDGFLKKSINRHENEDGKSNKADADDA